MDPSRTQQTGGGLGGLGGAGGITGNHGAGGITGNHGAAAGGQKDYGDKAFDMLSKKSGHPMNASTGEKITDGARGVFEKVTG